MASQVSGSLGSANNGAIVTAVLVTNGRPNGVVTSDVVASGNFTLKGLAAGTYLIRAALNNNQNTDRAGSDVSNVLVLNTITVDGSTSYSI